MKVYISGGIAGLPIEQRKQEFEDAASQIRFVGHISVNPFDCKPAPHDGPCPKGYAQGEGHSSACHLRSDLRALLECDAIWLLDGWEQSRGARLEHSVAADCGLQIFYPPLPASLPTEMIVDQIRYLVTHQYSDDCATEEAKTLLKIANILGYETYGTEYRMGE